MRDSLKGDKVHGWSIVCGFEYTIKAPLMCFSNGLFCNLFSKDWVFGRFIDTAQTELFSRCIQKEVQRWNYESAFKTWNFFMVSTKSALKLQYLFLSENHPLHISCHTSLLSSLNTEQWKSIEIFQFPSFRVAKPTINFSSHRETNWKRYSDKQQT